MGRPVVELSNQYRLGLIMNLSSCAQGSGRKSLDEFVQESSRDVSREARPEGREPHLPCISVTGGQRSGPRNPL